MTDQGLLTFLGDYLTDERKSLIEEKLANRTRFVTVVLEDIYNPHNANAVVRTCECLGVQDMHVVEKRNIYDISPNVLQGSFKWISLTRYNEENRGTIVNCYEKLKSRGYRIVATNPTPQSTPLEQLDTSTPFALAFGTEGDGLTSEALKLADEVVHIPMVGFTESFNISVGAAICLYHVLGKIKRATSSWNLPGPEMDELRLQWYRNSVQRVEMLEKAYLEKEGRP